MTSEAERLEFSSLLSNFHIRFSHAEFQIKKSVVAKIYQIFNTAASKVEVKDTLILRHIRTKTFTLAIKGSKF